MFHATERLPHLLAPDAYGTSAQYEWEKANVFSRSWHFVALQTDLSKPGDFVTSDVCGVPIQVRNMDGTIRAVSNVCAHRHCLLTSERKGHSATLRCQYHGWEYGSSGQSHRIPLAQNFAPLDRTSIQIPVYRVETLGPLVFVNLDATAPGLTTVFGGSLESIRDGFGSGWDLTLSREFHQSVNWKIPVENSLEAYHVPAIHPDTFRDDPGEARSEHFLGDHGSWFRTRLPFAAHSKLDARFQRVEGHVLKLITGASPTANYQQHHVFPNILMSFTDMITLLHVIRPTGPQTCTSKVLQFGRIGKSPLTRSMGRLWGRLSAAVTLKILKEDFRLYPDIQRGLNSSQNPGMLGRCEERIHQFQQWLQKQQSRPNGQSTLSPVVGGQRPATCDCASTSASQTLAKQPTHV